MVKVLVDTHRAKVCVVFRKRFSEIHIPSTRESLDYRPLCVRFWSPRDLFDWLNSQLRHHVFELAGRINQVKLGEASGLDKCCALNQILRSSLVPVLRSVSLRNSLVPDTFINMSS